MRVNQWLPAAHQGDAIGDEALRIREVLRRAGFDSEVYALTVDDEVRREVRPFERASADGPADLTLLHFALPSPLSRAFAALAGRKLLLYHNLTPSSYFIGLDDELARIGWEGREELSALAGVADLALGDSEFNRRELERLGYRRTGVLPILLDFSRYRLPPSPVVEAMLDDQRANFLFVGRVFPNKRYEDLLRLAFFYKKYVSENFRFLLVGRAGRMERYQQAIEARAESWGLRPAEFAFTGHLAWEDLLACYRSADVFVSMSEHEGFAVPLVECMLLDLPILAYAAGAVPDTLGGAGVIFREKKFEEIAEMAHLLATDGALAERVVAGQRERLTRFAPERVEAELIGFVEEVLG
jgi:glycosyltransferase involved in cell wall biosynthesis